MYRKTIILRRKGLYAVHSQQIQGTVKFFKEKLSVLTIYNSPPFLVITDQKAKHLISPRAPAFLVFEQVIVNKKN